MKDRIKKLIAEVKGNKNARPYFLYFAVLALVVLFFLLRVSKLPLGNSQWTWNYVSRPLDSSYYFPLLAVLFLGVILFLALRLKINEKFYLPLLVVAVFVLLISFVGVGLDQPSSTWLDKTIRHSGVTSYFSDAQKINNLGEFLHQYPKLIPSLEMHSQTHPPGPIVFFYGSIKLSQITGNSFNPALYGAYAIILLASSSVVLVYYLTKKLFDHRTALIASSLYGLTPALVMFTPEMDQVYPLFFLILIYLLIESIEKKKYLLAWPIGLLWAASLFFSYLFLTFALAFFIICGIYYLNSKFEDKKTFVRFALGLLIRIALVFILAHLVYGMIFGNNLLDIYRASMPYHKAFLATKTYSLWLVYNLYDFILFLGLPVTFGIIFSLRKSRPNIILWFLIAMLLIIDLSGKNRGEVARIWLFLTPFAAIAASSYIKKYNNIIVWAVIILSILQIVIFRKYIVTITL